jgi:hypothetical protein
MLRELAKLAVNKISQIVSFKFIQKRLYQSELQINL